MDGGAALHGKWLSGFFIGYANSRLPFYHRQVPSQRALKACFLEHDGMQRLREAAHLVESLLRDLGDFTKVRAQGRAFGQLLSSARQHGADSGKNLTKLIVQFARDVTQRGFLHGDQLLREFAALRGERRELYEQTAVPAD